MLTIIDYGCGNVGSIKNMLKKIGVDSVISSNTEDIKRADKFILSGVGSFDTGMESLEKLGLIDLLKEKVIGQRTPILGICLGMQLLTEKSEEGGLPGLGFVEAETVRFRIRDSKLKIPHMGWNLAKPKKESPIFKEMQSDVLTTTMYGYEFTSSFQKDNIIGVQFHPEKSHKVWYETIQEFCRELLGC
jgi:glutamine amidotransferase